MDYFEQYQEACNIHIKNVYESEKEDLSESERKNVDEFLSTLSDEYEKTPDLNVAYLVDTTKTYFEKRSLENLFEKGSQLVSAGKSERARGLLETHRVVVQETTKRFNPFEVDEVRSYNIESRANRLFSLDGRVGEYLGDFERSWFISFTAPEKRGKTWVLEEVTFQALTNRLKALFISLEMNNITLKKRWYQRLTARPPKSIRSLIFPIMDCLHNQTGECIRKGRTNDITLIGKDKLKPNYRDEPDYKVCVLCRGSRNGYYRPAYWHTHIEDIPPMTVRKIEKKAEIFKKLYGNNLRVRAFPAFTATPNDIRAELQDLEYSEGFIPDIIVVDYIDILAPVEGNLSERGNIDATWKHFKAMAASRNCLVVTADQSNKASVARSSIMATDTSEDKRKNAHIDMKIAINQTISEESEKVMRLGILLNRHRDNNPKKQAVLLQSLALGQVILDSEIIYTK